MKEHQSVSQRWSQSVSPGQSVSQWQSVTVSLWQSVSDSQSESVSDTVCNSHGTDSHDRDLSLQKRSHNRRTAGRQQHHRFRSEPVNQLFKRFQVHDAVVKGLHPRHVQACSEKQCSEQLTWKNDSSQSWNNVQKQCNELIVVQFWNKMKQT